MVEYFQIKAPCHCKLNLVMFIYVFLVIFLQEKVLPLIFVDVKLLCNGAEGAVLANVTLNFENCPNFQIFTYKKVSALNFHV